MLDDSTVMPRSGTATAAFAEAPSVLQLTHEEAGITIGVTCGYLYNVFRPLSQDVLFCFPSEVLVTSWAAQ